MNGQNVDMAAEPEVIVLQTIWQEIGKFKSILLLYFYVQKLGHFCLRSLSITLAASFPSFQTIIYTERTIFDHLVTKSQICFL